MARYLVATGWGHIFEEDGVQRERTTRFVYDRETRTMPVLDVQRDQKWRQGSEIERDDVIDSLLFANAEALDSPEEWDLEPVDAIPDWN